MSRLQQHSQNYSELPAPADIADIAVRSGLTKANLPFASTVTLAIAAGVFVSFGAMYLTVVTTGIDALGFGPGRLLGGIVFSLGLFLVVVVGAELFTGNNLLVMAWSTKRISAASLLSNWGVVYAANFVGAAGTAALVNVSGILDMDGGAVGDTAAEIARTKVELGFAQAFIRGVLCNILVCLMVWLCYSAQSLVGKFLAVVFPISAFVALGFEHSIANMYFIPVALINGADGVTISGFLGNLLPVTLGNIAGGSGFVGLMFAFVYLRDQPARRATGPR
jgi:formate transporter